MIKENQKYLNRLLVIIDTVSILLSLIFAWFIRFKSGFIQVRGNYLSFDEYLKPVILIIPVYLILYAALKLYKPYRYKTIFEEFTNILKANIFGLLIFILILYLLKEVNYSRILLLIFFGTCIGVTFAERFIIRTILHRIRSKGYNLKHIVIIGYNDLTIKFLNILKKNKNWGYDVLAILDDNNAEKNDSCDRNLIYDVGSEAFKEIAAVMEDGQENVLGKLCNLEEYLNNYQVDEVYITLSIKEYDKLGRIINVCEKSGVRTEIIPDYYRYLPAKPYVEEIDGLPIINTRYIPLDNLGNNLLKRFFDIVCSFLLIVLLSPLMLVTAVIIKITSPGPVFFKQERVGLNKRDFNMYKFRSMRVQNAEDEKKQWTTANDPRKTKFGTFMRKTNIDELPQLFNVLKGDMSLVGPRPERPYFVDKFREEIPKYMIKHEVRPGMTGWAQVNGWRGDTSIEKRVECDIYYIENWSFWFDIKILWLTIFGRNKNAY